MLRGILFAAATALIGTSPPALAAETFRSTIVIKDHKFEPAELKLPADKWIVLTVDNQDPTPEEFESHELKVEKVVPGASKGVVRFGPLTAGRYPFFGEFNEATAQGAVVVE
jgi:hypothetical protein